MSDIGTGTDQLVISRRRVALATTVPFLIGVVCSLVIAGVGIGLLASGPGAGWIALGVVLLAGGVVGAVLLVRGARRQVEDALVALPLIELTPADFHMRDAAGTDHWVRRSRTASVAWRHFQTSGGQRGGWSKLDFFDADGKRVGSWDLHPNLGQPMVRWLRAHGVAARVLANSEAIGEAPFARDHDRK